MMQRQIVRVLQNEPYKKRAAAHSRIERWLRGTYAFLFSAVLPLLCWGGVADPHHAHWSPHFVFAEPPPTHFLDTTANGVDSGQVVWHDHEPCLHPPGAHPPQPTLATTTDENQPLGQAVPVTVLAQLLVLAMWAVGTLRRPAHVPFVIEYPLTAPGTATVRVPTPPPRLLFVNFA